jgi:hypothetical protein
MSSGECEKSKTMRLKPAYNPKAGSNKDKSSGKFKDIIPKRNKTK